MVRDCELTDSASASALDNVDNVPADELSSGNEDQHQRLPRVTEGKIRRRHPVTGRRESKSTTGRAGRSSRGEGNKIVQEAKAGLFANIASDAWNSFKMMLRLISITYPIWKWLVLLYLIWLAISYLVIAFHGYVAARLQPICSIPYIGPRIPLCLLINEFSDRPINVSKVSDSQEGLNVVRSQVGESYELATGMAYNEFAVRDLKIRVRASNLSHKWELVKELEALSRYTKETAKGLSRFTAKTYKTIDTVVTFNNYAANKLEGIADRQNRPLSLPGRILTAISPRGALNIMSTGQTEEQVKKVILITSTRIADKVRVLSVEAFEQDRNLILIVETLDRIKELCQDELDDLPSWGILSVLWALLAGSEEYDEYKSHKVLLQDLEQFFYSATEVVKQTTVALNRMNAELEEFREEFATPGLILGEDPLEVIVASLRKAAERLEGGGKGLGYRKVGEIPAKATLVS